METSGWPRHIAIATLVLGMLVPPAGAQQPPGGGEPDAQSAESPDTDPVNGDESICEMKFRLSSFTFIVGMEDGCGRLSCGDQTVDVELHGRGFGLLGIQTLEGVAHFYHTSGDDDPDGLLGSYSGTVASGGVGIGGRHSRLIKDHSSVEMRISALTRGIAVDVGRGRLTVSPRDGGSCDVAGSRPTTSVSSAAWAARDGQST